MPRRRRLTPDARRRPEDGRLGRERSEASLGDAWGHEGMVDDDERAWGGRSAVAPKERSAHNRQRTRDAYPL